ncbi:hypothetical protein LZ30DRAFT_737454 [Colletotrichum cereale]|nr:hypothetical protein LZ30DRAFT_737454 [Colletotrichum cereale]
MRDLPPVESVSDDGPFSPPPSSVPDFCQPGVLVCDVGPPGVRHHRYPGIDPRRPHMHARWQSPAGTRQKRSCKPRRWLLPLITYQDPRVPLLASHHESSAAIPAMGGPHESSYLGKGRIGRLSTSAVPHFKPLFVVAASAANPWTYPTVPPT